MCKLMVNDLVMNEELDSKSLKVIKGGYGFIFNRPTTIPVDWPPKPIVDKDDPRIPTPDDLPPRKPSPPPMPKPRPRFGGGWGWGSFW